MASDKFRQELREESRLWRKEGLITPDLEALLSQRYGFDQLDKEASSQFLNILLGLGGILLGLGAITFVAANWQGMSPLVKVLLLMGSLIGVNVAGFSLWNNGVSLSKQRWGHALLLLGVLLLGANIGLLPQIFHQSGPIYGLYLVWGLGVLVMAAGLRLGSLAVASLILLTVGFFAFDGYGLADKGGTLGLGEAAMVFFPLILVFWFLPLAHWCRSRWLFALSAIALSLSIFTNVIPRGSQLPPWLALPIGFFLPAALLWAYDAQAWRFSLKSVASPVLASTSASASAAAPSATTSEIPQGKNAKLQAGFRTIARSLSLVTLTLSLYSLSFHFVWESGALTESWGYGNDASLLWLLDDLLLVVLASLGWVGLLRHWPGMKQFQLRSLNSAMVALLILVPVGLLFWVGIVGSLPVIAPFIVNILLALMAIGLIRDGLALGLRSCFWLGMVLLVLDIITRTFEYDTGLTVKALVLTLCGIAVLIAGVWFEKKSQAKLAINTIN